MCHTFTHVNSLKDLKVWVFTVTAHGTHGHGVGGKEKLSFFFLLSFCLFSSPTMFCAHRVYLSFLHMCSCSSVGLSCRVRKEKQLKSLTQEFTVVVQMASLVDETII